MTFDGFGLAALAFLEALGGRDRDWFQAHKKEYDAEVASPAKAFVSAMTDELRAGAFPLIEGQPKTNGSIAPINNDLRFKPDASPYKDHLLFKWWEGPDKKLAPTLWVRLSSQAVGFAAGVTISDIGRWRDAVGGSAGEVLATAIEKLSKGREVDVAGSALKRVPAPWPQDHPRADLLRHKGFQVRWLEPLPASVGSAAFVGFCAAQLEQVADVHRWLVAELS